MIEADLAFADSLRGIIGWNQTMRDWQRLLAAQPQGCFIAEWDSSAVGTATTTRYGAGLAWIGMLLVHPDHRGRGVGSALLEHCLNHLSGTPCIKLDATPLGKKLYDKLGFREEWPLKRWEARGFDLSHERIGRADLQVGPTNTFMGRERLSSGQMAFEISRANASHTQPAISTALEPWDASSLARVERFDSQMFGAPRQRMLAGLAADSFKTLICASADGAVAGYGFLRRGSKALYLGPVVALSVTVGVSLIKALLAEAKGQPVYWDAPDGNAAVSSLLKELGFVPQRQLVRMYLGRNEYPCDASRYFAIADPAIG